MKQTITLNVGLLSNHKPARAIHKATVLSALASLGFRVLIHRELTAEEAGGGEPTLAIFALPPDDWSGALYLAACELDQTAIAASFDSGESGHLIGPGASAWNGGRFDPEWFFGVSGLAPLSTNGAQSRCPSCGAQPGATHHAECGGGSHKLY